MVLAELDVLSVLVNALCAIAASCACPGQLHTALHAASEQPRKFSQVRGDNEGTL